MQTCPLGGSDTGVCGRSFETRAPAIARSHLSTAPSCGAAARGARQPPSHPEDREWGVEGLRPCPHSGRTPECRDSFSTAPVGRRWAWADPSGQRQETRICHRIPAPAAALGKVTPREADVGSPLCVFPLCASLVSLPVSVSVFLSVLCPFLCFSSLSLTLILYLRKHRFS